MCWVGAFRAEWTYVTDTASCLRVQSFFSGREQTRHKRAAEIEATVKHAKKVVRVAEATKRDPYLILLDYRNTPQEGLDTTPAQRLKQHQDYHANSIKAVGPRSCPRSTRENQETSAATEVLQRGSKRPRALKRW